MLDVHVGCILGNAHSITFCVSITLILILLLGHSRASKMNMSYVGSHFPYFIFFRFGPRRSEKGLLIMLIRRILSLLYSVLITASVFSQNTLTIHQKDGQQFSFGFEEKPLVTFTETDLVVKTTKVELRYELLNVSKFTFDEKSIDDAVISVVNNKTSITLDEYTVCISEAKADIVVRLIASNGQILKSYKTDSDGSVTFSISELPEGTYIIASESLTCKIIKK